MADEEPAPAPTPSLEDGLYTILRDAIGEACEGVDNNTASLAVHKAMAKAMADVVTDHKITEDGAINLDQKFIESPRLANTRNRKEYHEAKDWFNTIRKSSLYD